MTSTDVPRNSTQQKVGELKVGRVTNSNLGLFTATRKTIVTSITGIVDAIGSDLLHSVAIKRGATFTPLGEFVAVNKQSVYIGEFTMDIGDIITHIGDSGGTNGTLDMSANIREL